MAALTNEADKYSVCLNVVCVWSQFGISESVCVHVCVCVCVHMYHCMSLLKWMWGCMYLCFVSIDQTIPCYLKATSPAIAISYCDPKMTITCPPKSWGHRNKQKLCCSLVKSLVLLVSLIPSFWFVSEMQRNHNVPAAVSEDQVQC